MPNYHVEARFVNLEGQKVTQVWQILGASNTKAAQNQLIALIEPFSATAPPQGDSLTARGIEILHVTELPKIACLTTTVGKGKLRIAR